MEKKKNKKKKKKGSQTVHGKRTSYGAHLLFTCSVCIFLSVSGVYPLLPTYSTKSFSILRPKLVVLQMVELSGTVFLLRNTAKLQCKSINFLKGNNDSREGVIGSALGLGCLVGFIFITSLVADEIFGNIAEANMCLGSGQLGVGEDNGEWGCIEKRVFCSLPPILEEIVYRRFLLTSLASRMDWRKALVISSGVFAASHFSGAAVWDRVRSRGMLQLVREFSLVGGRSLLVRCLDTPPCVAFLSQPGSYVQR